MPARTPTLVDATPEWIAEAAGRLRAGELVAFPTETVYGLGADATDDSAVAKIFAAKDRPSFNPLIVHLADVDQVESYAVQTPVARMLGTRFWPGPLTLVLPRTENCSISPLASAGLNTVALRIPAHPVARALLAEAEIPVVAPSANPSGRLSPTTAAHVAQELGTKVSLILDAGPCPLGLESTVIGFGPDGRPILLRPGGLAVEDIEIEIGPLTVSDDIPDRPTAPGQLESHYAPELPVRLNATEVAADEALLAFGAEVPAGAMACCNLSPDGDLAEAAANLFQYLHELEVSGARAIAVMPIPEHGLGRAINDRLTRASAASTP